MAAAGLQPPVNQNPLYASYCLPGEAAESMMGTVVLVVSHPLENEQALLVASTAADAAVALRLQVT